MVMAPPDDGIDLTPPDDTSDDAMNQWWHGLMRQSADAGHIPAEAVPPTPDYGYGNRFGSDTPKGKGYFGPLKRPDGDVMTEFSVGVNLDGKETQVPSLVPTLTKDEVSSLLNSKPGDAIPQSVVEKAAAHAKDRLAMGKSPFADEGEQQNLYPELERVQGQPDTLAQRLFDTAPPEAQMKDMYEAARIKTNNAAYLPTPPRAQNSPDPRVLTMALNTAFGHLPDDQQQRIYNDFAETWKNSDGSEVAANQAFTAAQQRYNLEQVMALEDALRSQASKKAVPQESLDKREKSAQAALKQGGGDLQKTLDRVLELEKPFADYKPEGVAQQILTAAPLALASMTAGPLGALSLQAAMTASPETGKLGEQAGQAAGAPQWLQDALKTTGTYLPYTAGLGAMTEGVLGAAKGAAEAAGAGAAETAAKQAGVDFSLPVVGSVPALAGAIFTGKGMGLAAGAVDEAQFRTRFQDALASGKIPNKDQILDAMASAMADETGAYKDWKTQPVKDKAAQSAQLIKDYFTKGPLGWQGKVAALAKEEKGSVEIPGGGGEEPLPKTKQAAQDALKQVLEGLDQDHPARSMASNVYRFNNGNPTLKQLQGTLKSIRKSLQGETSPGEMDPVIKDAMDSFKEGETKSIKMPQEWFDRQAPPPGEATPIEEAKQRIFDYAKQELGIRDSGVAEEEIAAGRSGQAGGVGEAIGGGREAGLSPQEIVESAHAAARMGQLRTTVPKIELTGEHMNALYGEAVQAQESGKIQPLDFIVDTRALRKMSLGQALTPSELDMVVRVHGADMAKALDALRTKKKPPPTKGPKAEIGPQEFPPTQGALFPMDDMQWEPPAKGAGLSQVSTTPEKPTPLKAQPSFGEAEPVEGQFPQTDIRTAQGSQITGFPGMVGETEGPRTAGSEAGPPGQFREQATPVPLQPDTGEGKYPVTGITTAQTNPTHWEGGWKYDPKYQRAKAHFNEDWEQQNPALVGTQEQVLAQMLFDSNWIDEVNTQDAIKRGQQLPFTGDIQLKPGEEGRQLETGIIDPKDPTMRERIRQAGKMGLTEVAGLPGAAVQLETAFHFPTFRQGLGYAVTHPRIWGRALNTLAEVMFGSAETANALQAGRDSNPWIGGNYATDMGQEIARQGLTWHDVGGKGQRTIRGQHGNVAAELRDPYYSQVNQSFLNRLIQKVPLLARFQAASTEYLNALRELGYASEAQKLWDSGIHDNLNGAYTSLANTMNVITGRGNLNLRIAGVPPLFSSRNFSAKFETVGSVFNARGGWNPLGPGARAVAMQSLLGDAAFGLSILGLAQATGAATVNWDPTKPGWLKAKFGKTSVDPFGGMSAVAKLAVLAGTAGYEAAVNGDVSKAESIGKGAIANFIGGQLGPVPQIIKDTWTGQDWKGDPYNLVHEITSGKILWETAVPIAWRSLYEAAKVGYETGGLKGGLEGAALSIPSFGAMGVETNNSLASQVADTRTESLRRLAADPNLMDTMKQANISFDPADLPSAVTQALATAGVPLVDPARMQQAVQDALKNLSYNELPSGLQKLVDEGAVQLDPALRQAYTDHRRATGDVFQQVRDQADGINKEYNDSANAIMAKGTNRFNDALKTNEQNRQAALNELYNSKDPRNKLSQDYQNAIKALPAEDPRVWSQQWQDAYSKHTDATKAVDFEAVDQDHANMLRTLYQTAPDQYHLQVANLAAQAGMGEAQKTQIVQLKDRANKALQDYYALDAQARALPVGSPQIAVINKQKNKWLQDHPVSNALDWELNGTETRSVAALKTAAQSGLKPVDQYGRPDTLHLAGTKMAYTADRSRFFDTYAKQIDYLINSDTTADPKTHRSQRDVLLQHDIAYDAMHYLLEMTSPATTGVNKGKVTVYHNPEAIRAQLQKWGFDGRDDNAGMAVR